MRLINAASYCFALTCALLLYGLSYETRRLEGDVLAQERAVDAARSDIAVLKAERGHLSRPERIDPLARSHLAARMLLLDRALGTSVLGLLAAAGQLCELASG